MNTSSIVIQCKQISCFVYVSNGPEIDIRLFSDVNLSLLHLFVKRYILNDQMDKLVINSLVVHRSADVLSKSLHNL